MLDVKFKVSGSYYFIKHFKEYFIPPEICLFKDSENPKNNQQFLEAKDEMITSFVNSFNFSHNDTDQYGYTVRLDPLTRHRSVSLMASIRIDYSLKDEEDPKRDFFESYRKDIELPSIAFYCLKTETEESIKKYKEESVNELIKRIENLTPGYEECIPKIINIYRRIN